MDKSFINLCFSSILVYNYLLNYKGGFDLSIKFLINDFYDKLSKTEKKIADYILKHIEEIKEFTSAELANNAQVGQSSVIKFIKKIGFQGFTDFKIKLSEELASQKAMKPLFLHNNISSADTIYEATKKIAYSHINSIEETTSRISYNHLNKVIDLLEGSKKVVIVGVGASSLVGKDFQHKLTKVGKLVLHDLDPHVQITQAVTADSDDLILAISHSGETKVVIEAIIAGRKNGAGIVSITGSKNNSISALSDISLYTVAVEDFLRSSALSSRIAQLTLIDALFIGLIKRDHVKLMDYITESSSVLRKLNSIK